MKLEVGMYVRTRAGLIAKYIKKNNTYKEHIFDGRIQWFYEYYRNEIDFDEWDKFIENYAVKSSHNIKKLIEVGDIITYEFPTALGMLKYENVTVLEDLLDVLKSNDEYKILSIVTKEQYENMMYKVGD